MSDEILVYQSQPCTRELALVVTIYNERSNSTLYFSERLAYYRSLADSHADICDLFLVDDGSTDGSQAELKKFVELNTGAFNVIALPQNRQKVGAIRKALSIIESEYILCSDFDTDFVGLEKITQTISTLKQMQMSNYMGGVLRVLPSRESNAFGKYHVLGFASGRISNLRTQKEGHVSVMLGPASLYRRNVLQRILSEHSGQFHGDDLQSTVIGYRLGYKAFYEDDIYALTQTPKHYIGMLKQKIRWKQGFLHVLLKERDFLRSQMKEKTLLGQQFSSDIQNMAIYLLFPFITLLLFAVNGVIAVALLFIVYLYYEFELITDFARNWDEISDFKSSLTIVPILPLLWLLIESPAWMCGVCKFGISHMMDQLLTLKGE